MRQVAQANGISVKAYSGSSGVLLAMNITPERRAGLLGFAIKRRDGRNGRREWLLGALPFPHMSVPPGTPLRSNIAPIQRFRWSDYRVYPGVTYEYQVYPVYGTATAPELGEPVAIALPTASLDAEHSIVFNRAAAASQAFSRKFPEVEALLDAARKARQPVELPPPVLEWLSRGVLEQITGLLQRAIDPSWAVDIAIYEYELEAIADAVQAAHQRGAIVRVVYHAKTGDKQTHENEQRLAGLPPEQRRARLTSALCHHKFIVLSRLELGQRVPQAVLCGSTNFTHNGVYRQANVVHTVHRNDVAQNYLSLFEGLFQGDTPRQTKAWIDRHNAIAPETLSDPVFTGFSPRSGYGDLQAFIDCVNAAQRDVLFCTAFDLHDSLEQAFLGKDHDSILRYGLQNTRSKITGIHADRTADFTATAMLSTGLEGFLKESTQGQRGNILIHTKLMVVDFTSDAPVVISGSHNFSGSASRSNDENFLILRGATDIADCYGCELMRLYDHYRFRYRVKDALESGEAVAAPRLKPDDSWTEEYFTAGNLKTSDRLRFAGA